MGKSSRYAGALVPVTTLATTEVTKRTEEVDLSQVRAEGFDEVELAVGALPEHEIAQALLSRGANNEVGVWLASGVQVPGNRVHADALFQVIERSSRCTVSIDEAPHCASDFCPPAVTDGEVYVHS